MSYSQGGEEEVILKAVEGRPPGHLIDIGAGDGKRFSNSRALIELGWSALLVEPDFESFAKLYDLYKGDDKIRLLNAPVMMDPHPVTFWKAKPEEEGLCSTTMEANRKKWDGHFSGSYIMQGVTPAMIRNIHPTIPQILLVDTEGNSVDIMGTLVEPWVGSVKLICVEHDGRDIEVAGWGRKHGMNVRYLSAENLILVRE